MLKHPFDTVRMKIRQNRSHRNLTQTHSAKLTLDTSDSPSNDSKRLTLTRSCSVDGLDQQVALPNKIFIKVTVVGADCKGLREEEFMK